MVLKKCIYLILSVWLVNAVVCFHADTASAPLPDHVQYPGESCDEGDTVLGYATQIFDTDDHSNSDKNSHPIKRAPRKILPRRIAELNAQLPFILDFLKGNVGIDIAQTFGTRWFNKAFLPGYYNFLFRYKPF
ncbi:hypothetical protein GCM10027049_15490 [Mucilaginibacter puniceus]